MANPYNQYKAGRAGLQLGNIQYWTKKVKVGDIVTCRYEEEAFYSDYAGRPHCMFQPGMRGVVGAIKVPAIITEQYYVCVDFHYDAGPYNPTIWGADPPVEQQAQRCTWRVALYYDNILTIKKENDHD